MGKTEMTWRLLWHHKGFCPESGMQTAWSLPAMHDKIRRGSCPPGVLVGSIQQS